MIRRLFTTAVALTFLAPTVAAAADPYETVLASPHNFFARTEFPIGTRVCYGCHAEGPERGGPRGVPQADAVSPPDASLPADESASPIEAPPPLWERGAKAYVVPLPMGLGGSSTACLGCHDGVLGQEVHQIGTPDDPKFDHPYDVVYPRRANGKFVPKNPTVNQYRYWSIPDLHDGDLILPTGPTSSWFSAPEDSEAPRAHIVRTSNGRVQCDSCHDPHDNASAPFLRAPAKDLCFICHDR